MDSATALSLEEADLRRRYNTARKAGSVARADALWTQVMAARRRAAENTYGSLFVTVRYRHSPERKAVYLAGDLRNMKWIRNARRKHAAPRLGVEADCNLMCQGDLPPCGVAGPCPHPREFYVTQDDNDTWVYRRLAEMAGPRPRLSDSGSWRLGDILRDRGATNW